MDRSRRVSCLPEGHQKLIESFNPPRGDSSFSFKPLRFAAGDEMGML